MKAHEILSDESKWTKGSLALDEEGNPCYPDSPLACRFCLEGVMMRAYPGQRFVCQKLIEAMDAALLPKERPCDWNDAPERTFEEVRALLIAANL